MNDKWKNILIAVLVAYVVLDVMKSSLLRRESNCLEAMTRVMKTDKGMMAIVIALLVGLAVWYLLKDEDEDDKLPTA